MAEIQTVEAPIWMGSVEDMTTYAVKPPDLWGLTSYSNRLTVKDPLYAGDFRTGRGLIGSCFAGKYMSITLRSDRTARSGKRAYKPCGYESCPTRYTDKYKVAPETPKHGDGTYALSRERVVALLYSIVFASSLPSVGLTLIAGSTSSSNSVIARGITRSYLADAVSKVTAAALKQGATISARRPHLLTIEDPIEKHLFEDKLGNPEHPFQTQARAGIDYTPRQIGVDVDSLRQALMVDALRQTPAIVYIGELRNGDDLATAMEFAATGHLAIATMHSGSLVEAMDRAFEAANAKTPQDRGNVASVIRSIVHVRQVDVVYRDAAHNRVKEFMLMPAVYLGTSQGVAAVVADGLSAFLPTRAYPVGSASPFTGRTALVEHLVRAEAARWDGTLAPHPIARIDDRFAIARFKRSALNAAMAQDIEGV